MKFFFKETKVEPIFWGKQKFFKNLDFNFEKAQEYLISLNLEESNYLKLVEEFCNYYKKNKISRINQTTFDKSLELFEKVYNLSNQKIYDYLLFEISNFKKKEDFEIFYYLKKFNFLQEGRNNIYVELLNWLSNHENEIHDLIKKSQTKEESLAIINKHLLIIGTSGKGKSQYIPQLLLKNKNKIIIIDKGFSLEEFLEEDKDYFFNLFINLTKEKNLNNFQLQINKNKDSISFKGVSIYIEKRLNCEYLRKKLENKKDQTASYAVKKMKI